MENNLQAIVDQLLEETFMMKTTASTKLGGGELRLAEEDRFVKISFQDTQDIITEIMYLQPITEDRLPKTCNLFTKNYKLFQGSNVMFEECIVTVYNPFFDDSETYRLV